MSTHCSHKLSPAGDDSWVNLLDETVRLRAEIEQLRAALSEVEWNGYAYIGLEPCPCCGNERSKGHHTDDCLVGRAVQG